MLSFAYTLIALVYAKGCLSAVAVPGPDVHHLLARAIQTPSPDLAGLDTRDAVKQPDDGHVLAARQRQIPFQVCPEQHGLPKKNCPECGGDTKTPGFCDTILLNGPQEGCPLEGCGVYCQCNPVNGEQTGPTNQIPFQVCPEALGQPKKACKDCGGDSKVAGVCNNVLLSGKQGGCIGGCGYYCQCTNGGETVPGQPSPGQTHLVSTVVNGQSITGTFEPTTISEYTALRQSTTVTTTKDGKETALAIFAGGVAWWLLGQSAAGAVLAPAPEIPEGGEEDDKSCPDPKDKCEDCGGSNALDICQSGTDAGCTCEDKTCPTGDEQPKCSDQTCQGNDQNKCTAGDHNDCDCAPQDECPEGDDILSCDECGGSENGKCKGLADQNNKWKDCDCVQLSADDAVPDGQGYPFSFADLSEVGSYLDSLPKMGATSPEDTAKSPDPGCGSNSADKVPEKIQFSDGEDDPNGLLFRLRQVVCSNQCQQPQGVPTDVMVATAHDQECVIAVALPDNVEAWIYRATASVDSQWQQCWDATEKIINECVKNGPNNGWVNGPHPYQYYQTGFRPINPPDAKHDPLDPAKHLGVPGGEGGKTEPEPKEPALLDCNRDCCGTVPDAQWCVDNCRAYHNTKCGLCVCG